MGFIPGRTDVFFVRDGSGQICYEPKDLEAHEALIRELSAAGVINEAEGRISPGMQNGKPTDAVFKAFAIVPMSGLRHGDPPHEWPPFDVDELFRLIQKEEVPNVG
jgi:hypothetical protein